jgi:hypothetical protein
VTDARAVTVRLTKEVALDPDVIAVVASEFMEWLDRKGLLLEQVTHPTEPLQGKSYRELGQAFSQAASGGTIKND